MEFRVLGPLEVCEAGRPLSLGRGRPRALLALLLLNADRVVAVERLIDGLWGEGPPASAHAIVHNYVSRLRKLLGGGLLETRPPGYVLRLDGHELDLARFEELLRGARARRADDVWARRELLGQALELWRGEPLADLAREPFAIQEIPRLENLRLSALEERVEADLRLGRHAEVAPELEALVTEHPLRERLRALLMQALYAGGRQAEALEVYQDARSILVEDLGLEPSEELQQLERAILTQDPALEHRAPRRAPTRSNLPEQPDRLIGRDGERRRLLELLEREDVRVITLVGPGGSGKTRLALAVAAELLNVFDGRVYLVELASLNDPTLVPSAIAEALRAEQPELSAIGQTITGPTLLVLDNVEHLLDGAPFVSELSKRNSELKIVTTSRAPLRVSGEHELRVPPLDHPNAVSLFVERADAVRADFEAGEAVAEICRRLDGLPLAIELAAARVRALEPEELLEHLDLSVLAGGRRDAPPRLQTLRATIDWSRDLLGEREAALFDRLGVFVGGFTLEAAEAVCDADLTSLLSLVDQSLIFLRGGRYWMLEPIREYALEQVERRSEAAEVRDRHAAWYVGFAQRAEPGLESVEQGAWVRRVEAELGNVLAALGWAADDQSLQLRIVTPLWRFWHQSGYAAEVARLVERGLEADLPPILRERSLRLAGWHLERVGERERARGVAEERLELARMLGEGDSEVGSLSLLAVLAQKEGEIERARFLHEACVARSRELGTAGRPWRHLGNFAGFLIDQDLPDEAAEQVEEALDLAREAGAAVSERASLTADLGEVRRLQGRYSEAEDLMLGAVSMLRSVHDRYFLVFVIFGLAEIYAEMGREEEAARLVGAHLAELEATGLQAAPSMDRLQTRLVESLGEDACAHAVEEGRSLGIAELADLQLAEVGR